MLITDRIVETGRDESLSPHPLYFGGAIIPSMTVISNYGMVLCGHQDDFAHRYRGHRIEK